MQRNKRNYYRILHVQPDAPLALIKASYRTLMQKLRRHPDLGGDQWDAAVINEAYAVLSDRRRREAYDARLFGDRRHTDTARQTSAQRAAPPKPPDNGQRNDRPVPPACRSAYQTGFVDAHDCAFCGSTFHGVLDATSDCAQCQSPLSPIEPLELGACGKRTIQRVPLMSALTLHTAWPGRGQTALLCDLSPNGLQFSSASRLAPGQRVRLACPMFSAVAEVANRSNATHRQQRYGARFITLRYHAARGTFVSASA